METRRAVAALCAVQFVDVLGVTSVVTALPRMLADLHAGPAVGGLVVTIYAVLFGGCLVLAGRVGDLLGHRRVLLAGLAGFGVSSVLAGVATSGGWLVACRGLQGMSAAASVPAALTLLLAATDRPDRRRRALGAWTAAGAAAGASGFLVGGVVTDLVGWRAVFLLNVPVTAVLVVAVARWVRSAPAHRDGRLDLVGSACLTLGVMALVLGAAEMERAGVRGFLTAAALLGAGGLLVTAFSRVERRSEAPLIPPAAWRNRPLTLGCAGSFLTTATTSATGLFATLHAQDVAGLGPAQAGLVLLPFSLAVIVGSVTAPRLLVRRTHPTVMVIGLAVVAAGNLLLLATTTTGRLWPLVVGVTAAGVGLGLSSVASTGLGAQVAIKDRGLASATLNTAAQLGTALGVAALVALANGVAGGTSTPALVSGQHAGWAAAAGLALAGALGVAAVARRVRSPAAASPGRSRLPARR